MEKDLEKHIQSWKDERTERIKLIDQYRREAYKLGEECTELEEKIQKGETMLKNVETTDIAVIRKLIGTEEASPRLRKRERAAATSTEDEYEEGEGEEEEDDDDLEYMMASRRKRDKKSLGKFEKQLQDGKATLFTENPDGTPNPFNSADPLLPGATIRAIAKIPLLYNCVKAGYIRLKDTMLPSQFVIDDTEVRSMRRMLGRELEKWYVFMYHSLEKSEKENPRYVLVSPERKYMTLKCTWPARVKRYTTMLKDGKLQFN